MTLGMAERRDGSVDEVVVLDSRAEALLDKLTPGQTYFYTDLMRYAGVKPSGQQRFGHQVLGPLLETGTLEKVGEKPSMYMKR